MQQYGKRTKDFTEPGGKTRQFGIQSGNKLLGDASVVVIHARSRRAFALKQCFCSHLIDASPGRIQFPRVPITNSLSSCRLSLIEVFETSDLDIVTVFLIQKCGDNAITLRWTPTRMPVA